MKTEQTIDKSLLECSKINFENFEKVFPAILKHPYYLIAKGQLDEALGYNDLKTEQTKEIENG